MLTKRPHLEYCCFTRYCGHRCEGALDVWERLTAPAAQTGQDQGMFHRFEIIHWVEHQIASLK